ncbi:uncharacterized protein LOC132178314 [Corylus avellana]|uniref:uncharacterized protein LOC132178314 n=1 Tax=Corylus avellana TaxID=13451 RepID=UPI00286C161C|nr:uncharacterized protein LOC132178314 [Corylus avellana]
MDIEELHVAASAYYNNASSEVKQLAREFFESMDTNEDDTVSMDEFVEFFKGYSNNNMYSKNHFTALDRNRDGCLQFREVLTLYYIMKTRGVWCKQCRTCLTGLYFTCVTCFDSADDMTYDLCAACYSKRNFQHPHPSSSFLDSYVLLRSKNGTEANRNRAIVPRPMNNYEPQRASKLQTALRTLEAAISIGSIVTNCSIM